MLVDEVVRSVSELPGGAGTAHPKLTKQLQYLQKLVRKACACPSLCPLCTDLTHPSLCRCGLLCRPWQQAGRAAAAVGCSNLHAC